MPDYRNLAGSVRSFLRGGNQLLTERIKHLAHEYAEACRDVNQRLQRCQEFLNQGLRGEAIQLAETPPDLLDLVTLLDLPERLQWDELTARYGLPAAPAIPRQIAEALNEAYARQEPVQGLLRQHRLLALMRAPVKQRLEIMRHIAKVDLEGHWSNDILEFEKARLAEIQSETQAARAARDQAVLEELSRELTLASWRAEPSPQLINAVESALCKATTHQLRSSLAAVDERLQQALAAKDLEEARRLRDQMSELTDRADPLTCADLLDRVARALKWLSREEQAEAARRDYQAECRRLAYAIESTTRPGKLEAARQAVLRFNKAIPADLEQRYWQRLTQLKGDAARRRKALRRWACAGLCALLTMVCLLAYRAVRERRYRALVEQAQEYLDQGDREAAAQLFRELAEHNPSFLERSKLVELQDRLNSDNQNEAARAAAFRSALREAKDALPSDRRPTALERAWRFAGSPEERAKATEARSVLDNDIRNRVDDFRTRLASLQKSVSASDADTRLRELEPEIAELVREANGASKELGDLASPLTSQLAEVRREVSDRQQEQSLTTQMTAAFGGTPRLGTYASALEKFTNDLPARARSQGLTKALEAREQWLGVERWQQQAKPWLGEPFPDARTEADQRGGTCESFLNMHPDYVDANVVRLYRDVLAADPAKANSALADIFQGSLMRHALLVKTKEGEKYYLPALTGDGAKEAIRNTGVKAEVRYYVSQDGETESTRVEVKEVRPAPQTLIAKKWDALRGMRALTLRQWEAAVIELAKSIPLAQDLDPVLQLILLRRVLESASTGSIPLARALAKHKTYLEGLGLDLTVRWMDPHSKPAQAVRPKATKALQAFPSFTGVLDAAEGQRHAIEQELEKSIYVPFGWLSRDDKGAWQCHTGQSLPGSHILSIVELRAAQPGAGWRVIGRSVEGTVTLTMPARAEVAEGQIIFAQRDSPKE